MYIYIYTHKKGCRKLCISLCVCDVMLLSLDVLKDCACSAFTEKKTCRTGGNKHCAFILVISNQTFEHLALLATATQSRVSEPLPVPAGVCTSDRQVVRAHTAPPPAQDRL